MGRNIGSVVSSINDLVAELGLEKLAVSGDPGTSHPAKVEASKANIQPATEGARSAENTSDNKEEVTGQSIAEGKPADAEKEPGKSHVANITTATFVGEDPKVEQGYGTSVKDPGTTHPANATGSTDKAAADLGKCAEAVMAELKKLAEATVGSAKEAQEKIATLIDVKADAKAEEKTAAVDATITDYLTGYVKSAALIGELTADCIDGMADAMAKKAEGEGAPPPPEAEAAPAGPEAGGAPEGGAPGMDDEAAALAQAASEIAAELGCTPEDVLDAAAAELAQGGGQGGPDAGGAPAGPDAGGAPAGLPAGMEAQASVEIAALREKAAAYDKLMAENAAKAADEKQASVVKTAVNSALEQFMAKKTLETSAK